MKLPMLHREPEDNDYEIVDDADVTVVWDPEDGVLAEPHSPMASTPYEYIEIKGVKVAVPSSDIPKVEEAIERDKQEREENIGRYKVGDLGNIYDKIDDATKTRKEFDREMDKIRRSMGLSKADLDRMAREIIDKYEP